jgi:hypothetical protein
MFDQYEAYQEFTEQLVPLSLRHPKDGERAWLCALDGERWFSGRAHGAPMICLSDMAEPILGGMSGSPILASDGKAIGVCTTASGTVDASGTEDEDSFRESGPSPAMLSLPGWFIKELGDPGAA